MKNRNSGLYEIVSLNKKARSRTLKHLANGSERGAHLMHIKSLGLEDNEEPVPIRNEALRLVDHGNQKSDKDLVDIKSSYHLRSKSKEQIPLKRTQEEIQETLQQWADKQQ